MRATGQRVVRTSVPIWLALLLASASPAMAQGESAGSALGLALALTAGGLAALWLLRHLLLRRRQWQDMHARNARLTAANVELRHVAERAETKARMLDGALAAMADGIMVADGDFRLTGWNTRFPEHAGVPGRALRIGMSLEEVLRLQAEAGEFGLVDPEVEAAKRVAALRNGPLLERQVRDRPDGTRVELRRAPLPGGGFIALYSTLARPDAAPEVSLAAEFRQEWTSRVPRLMAAAADGDVPAAMAAAHTLRGIAGNAGWPEVAGTLGAIEAAASAGDVTEMRLLTSLLPVDAPA